MATVRTTPVAATRSIGHSSDRARGGETVRDDRHARRSTDFGEGVYARSANVQGRVAKALHAAPYPGADQGRVRRRGLLQAVHWDGAAALTVAAVVVDEHR